MFQDDVKDNNTFVWQVKENFDSSLVTAMAVKGASCRFGATPLELCRMTCYRHGYEQ